MHHLHAAEAFQIYIPHSSNIIAGEDAQPDRSVVGLINGIISFIHACPFTRSP